MITRAVLRYYFDEDRAALDLANSRLLKVGVGLRNDVLHQPCAHRKLQRACCAARKRQVVSPRVLELVFSYG